MTHNKSILSLRSLWKMNIPPGAAEKCAFPNASSCSAVYTVCIEFVIIQHPLENRRNPDGEPARRTISEVFQGADKRRSRSVRPQRGTRSVPRPGVLNSYE